MSDMRGGPRIPNTPFICWCEQRIIEFGGPDALKMQVNAQGRMCPDPTGARTMLATLLGVETRTLWRYMNYRDSVGRLTEVVGRFCVEDMLARAGVDFYSVYPDFEHERDIDLEPDEWCWECHEYVTPINGFCPWHTKPVELAA